MIPSRVNTGIDVPIKSVKRLSLNPNDFLVVNMKVSADVELGKKVGELLQKTFPDNPVLIFSEGIQIATFTPEQSEDLTTGMYL